MPRSAFLPDLMWPYDVASGAAVAVDRRDDPKRWLSYADAGVPVVTQWDAGVGAGRGSVPTSSSSVPSVVFRMLSALGAEAGHRVLEIGGRFAVTRFVLGLRVGDHHQAADQRDGARPVSFYGLTDRSWACVMFRDGRPEARVWQSGPRRLWDEVPDALTWWRAAGEPGHERFGLTVTAHGQRAWPDRPADAWDV